MMQKTLKGKEEDEEKGGAFMGIWDCGSPLYDSYELVSVTHIIDRHLMSLPYLGGRSKPNVFLARSFSRANDQVVPTTSIVSNSSSRKGSSPCEASASAAMVASSFDNFDVIRKLWKKKVNLGTTGTGRRKELHPEKTKTWLSALLKRIGFRKKRNNIRMHD